MRFRTTIFLLGFCYLGCASAVDEPYFSCHKDGDCPKGEICVELEYSDKVCMSPECEKTSDCESGEYCDMGSLQCRSYCDNDWDCNMTEYCEEITRRCLDEDTYNI